MSFPPLRYVDVSQVQHEGQTLICIRDPEGIVEAPLLLSPIAFFVASQLDGESSAEDIQRAFSQLTSGRAVRTEDIEQVVAFLDEHGYLLSPSFIERRNAIHKEFRETPIRPAYLAGKSYPSNAAELRQYLDSQFTREGGPGVLPGTPACGGAPVSCLIVPHIDFERGGHAYAHGFSRMAKAGKPDTVLVFGVAHTGTPSPFILTRKRFETPLATLDLDDEFIDLLVEDYPEDPFEHEIIHRTEHSIEFQAVMLAYLYGTDVRIVPVLCGAFLSESDGQEPDPEGPVLEFLSRCRQAIERLGRRVTVIASADLAHVGRTFGDDFDIDESVVDQVRKRDAQDLAHVLSANPEEWYRAVMRDENQRRVCGLNCIFSALKSVEGSVKQGELVHYGYAPDPSGGIVSFANIVLP
ncbi:MAG: AmmeMemoRadiSam system protein B [Candidatus Hydrogenedentes bacterium]|nr:AmmeMemoRadiSam system protein B [Candidatus Hydrogenedentota bacterium]